MDMLLTIVFFMIDVTVNILIIYLTLSVIYRKKIREIYTKDKNPILIAVTFNLCRYMGIGFITTTIIAIEVAVIYFLIKNRNDKTMMLR